MANLNTPRGLVPYRHFDGSYWNGSANVYYIPAGDANNYFIGDPVILKTASNDPNGIPAIQKATAGSGNQILGAIASIVASGNPQIAVTRDLPIYRQASVATYVLVADDPLLTYWIQDDNSYTGAQINQFSGQYAYLVAGAGGSTVTGYSSWSFAGNSTVAGGGGAANTTGQIKILRLLDNPADSLGNAQPPTGFNKWLVKINLWQHNFGAVGATS